MEKLNIIYVDDQREVLTTVGNELSIFEDYVNLEECESANEVLELMEELDTEGDYTAVVISDHVMPGKSGVELLSTINSDVRYKNTKKILLTGMATHADTIKAINEAHINSYFEKPWQSTDLIQKVKELLTAFILEKGLAYQPYMPILDQGVLLSFLSKEV